MGVQITELLPTKKVKLEDLKGKVFAVDTYNLLYQFLSSIRQPDGTLLTDSKGRVTSHLTGLFTRITHLMTYDMRFVFCFDGKVPDLKKAERQRRRALKQEAQAEYEQAAAEEDTDAMRKYASRTSKLTPEMIKDAKDLIIALGQCVIDAPSEGEAQASHICARGHADYVMSQDADCLMFGAPKLVRNLSITGRRKRPGAFAFDEVLPEVITLQDVLSSLDIDRDHLIALSMLVGTDYNIGGIHGIGPKKALALVRRHKNISDIFDESGWDFSTPWKVVFETIKDIEVSDDYKLSFSSPDRTELLDFLVAQHDFSRERVERSLERLGPRSQKGLGQFF